MRSSKSKTLDNWAISNNNIVPDFSGGDHVPETCSQSSNINIIPDVNDNGEGTQLYCNNNSDNEIDRVHISDYGLDPVGDSEIIDDDNSIAVGSLRNSINFTDSTFFNTRVAS